MEQERTPAKLEFEHVLTRKIPEISGEMKATIRANMKPAFQNKLLKIKAPK